MNTELILFILACALCFGIGWELSKVRIVRKYERRIAHIQRNVDAYVAQKTRERQ